MKQGRERICGRVSERERGRFLHLPCYLHVVDEAHQFVQQFEGQNGILHAVDGQTTPSLGTALLVGGGGGGEGGRER